MRKRIVLITLGIVVFFIIFALVTAEYYSSRPSFCGSCHIMKHYYESWLNDKKHSEKNVACVDCHYKPGEKFSIKAKFKGLGQLFSYFSTYVDAVEVRTRTTVSDISCTTSDCHPEQNLKDKKAKFTEKISYVHKTHFDKTVEGQKLHCATCHTHVNADKHFEVPKEICYICHFKEVKFSEGRSKCALCHELPEKPIEKPGKDEASTDRPITHKSIEEAKVSCQSCHYQLIQGTGEVKIEDCRNCHHHPELLEKAKDRKLMHEKHISEQNAKCFDCHRPILHKEFPPFDAVVRNCSECHPEPHIYQKMLLAGTGGIGIDKPYPIAHFDVKVNCLACHVEEGLDLKGRKFRRGSPQICTECHLNDQEKKHLAGKWQDDVHEALLAARDLEKEALEAIEKAKGNVSAKSLRKARARLKDAQANLRIADAGGGVHNKKYAMLLIDTAVTDLETIIEELQEKL
ncbi:MAG: NapC/NirT family cytochrome c [Nitrospirota bacterium]|nr:NapC/NirT family cytochrome c [Nitrospirota bacterium]